MISVSLDGGKTWIKCTEGVRVNIKELDVSDDLKGDLVFNFTHEGVITDLWGSGFFDLLGTSSEMYSDIVSDFIIDKMYLEKE